MTFAWFLKILLSSLLLPPGNGLALLVLASLRRRKPWAFGMAMCGGALILLQSLPLVGTALMGTLEDRAGAWRPEAAGAQAIVVLGSGLIRPEQAFGGETASERTLVRTRHGAQLARETGLPVLVSGGRPVHAEQSEAAVMADILEREFGVAVRWQEGESVDTAGNARLSARMLAPEGITRILLVTQAFHMPRARLLFEAQGFEVIPAPTHFVAKNGRGLEATDLIPAASALHYSYYALHEWLGIAWVRLSGH